MPGEACVLPGVRVSICSLSSCPRFVHGPGVLVDPGRGVLLTFRRTGGPGVPRSRIGGLR